MAVIGIDLGTTYSAAAVSYDGVTAQVLTNREGQSTTPSVVFFPETEDGSEEPLVGAMAKESADSAPLDVVQFIKREMGNPSFVYTTPNGTDYRPEEISAIILKEIKRYAELALGEIVTGAVVTVPAYFDDARRTATKQAGQIAGLPVLQVLNEPTAAAIAYGLSRGHDGLVVVYDFGGGTFDITLLRLHNGEFDVVATDGDPRLGGFDFDGVISDMIVAELNRQGCEVDDDDDRLFAQIGEKSEMIKRSLSNVGQCNTILNANGKTYRIHITRDQFEQEARSLVTRTRERLEMMLEEQRLSWSDIDQVLMIGGSTRIPMVRDMLQRISGKPLKYECDPDTAVAVGAAIYAAALSQGKVTQEADDNHGKDELVISDVTSQSLGVITQDSESNTMVNSVVIPRNSKIPCRARQMFTTVVDGQTEIELRITEGNDPDLEYLTIICDQTLGIPAYPAGAPIELIYTYGIDQTLSVEVVDMTANKSLGNISIDRQSNLSEHEVADMANRMQTTQLM